MAFKHGVQASLTLNGTDVMDYVSSISPQFEVSMAEMRHLGVGRVERLPGFQDVTLTLEGDFDPALDTLLWQAFSSGSEVTVVYGPQGSSAGSPKYTIPMLVTRYSPGPAGDDAVKASAELAGSGGAITKGTF